MKLPGVRAWAWECDFGLCRWAEPEKSDLSVIDEPSPEARRVLCRLVKESDLRRLIKELTDER